MDSTLEKTPTKAEQLRELLASARKDQKDMEIMAIKSSAKSKELSDALEGLLGWTEPDDQLPENLESKMDTAV